MKPVRLLLLSLCLNLALAGTAFLLFKPPPQRPAPSPTAPVAEPLQVEPSDITDLSAPVTYVTNRFHWRIIESADYEKYAANLRAIGCPEKTVRDIILASVERYYAAQIRKLEQKGPLWVTGAQRAAGNRERVKGVEDLKREEEALVRRSLGIEWFADNPRLFDGFEEQALSRFIFGPMPEETYQRLERLLGKYEALKGALERRNNAMEAETDLVRLENLYQQMRAELAVILAPSQVEELTARIVVMDFFGDLTFQGADLTTAEARQIALAKAAVKDPIRSMFNWPGQETDEERRGKEERFRVAVRNLLGEKRFLDFERAQDDQFRMLFEISSENGLPKEAAIKVYEMRMLAREEILRLRDDAALDEPARRQRLDEMRASLQPAVLSALGAKMYQDYLRRGGAWVTNLDGL